MRKEKELSKSFLSQFTFFFGLHFISNFSSFSISCSALCKLLNQKSNISFFNSNF
ncbi:uncharacterized protein ASCRUDRAFT_128231 [Ascoidea rubescens DSM 1968]|uniref:Uncharacterized protein n=1 Tax=Ascoidea rubescens DSM 1968 TaxID=1344418 RepID=A0A1D2V946_9ASCO|nr:hypothetical protein ASCRUDRAFT_128231 [Ascoidea rubescens DSM 1968]ODV58148.1 hypothetical protein ASCRUDRAFT_128231 [Ascoidea rubescens DSM 1968]